MPHSPLFYSLWAINRPLDQTALRRQADQLRECGLDGVVFHPRFYPNEPPYLGAAYMAQLSELIVYCKSAGIRFWIYDENGWPSGTVGGRMLARHPEFAQSWIAVSQTPCAGAIGGFTRNGTRHYVVPGRGGGVDYLNPDFTRRFIEMTYEAYRTGLSAEAFDYVEAFFCDEPEMGLGHAHGDLPAAGALPWTPRLPEIFRDRCGGDLIALLPLLFFEDEGSREARISFWECVSGLFCDAFLAPLNQWCGDHGKLFTGHVKGEEHPLFQAPMVAGSAKFRRPSYSDAPEITRVTAWHFKPFQFPGAALVPARSSLK